MNFSENEYPLEDFGINLFEEIIEGSEGIVEAPPGKALCYLGPGGSEIHQSCSSILDRQKWNEIHSGDKRMIL